MSLLVPLKIPVTMISILRNGTRISSMTFQFQLTTLKVN
jgi:hypothetical protein